MDVVQKRRMQRSGGAPEPRKRQLVDLIQLVLLYQEKSLLSDLDPSDKQYGEQAAAELSTVAAIPFNGAKKVLNLVSIYYNKNAWTFLKECRRLRIFDDYNFTKCYTAAENNDEVLSLSFLKCFMNGSDPKEHVGKLQEKRMLDNIALSYTASARDLCVTIFFKCVAVISTLCSYFPEEPHFGTTKAVDIIEKYLSDSWGSDEHQRQNHLRASRRHATDGWHIVDEVFKVQVQELKFWKDRMMKENASAKEDFVLTESDVTSTAHLWCHRIVVEFLAWAFRFCIHDKETVESFLESMCDVMDKMNEKLAEETGCYKKEEIPAELINSTLTLIQREAPTMAEIRYDTEKMRPNQRNSRSNRVLQWIPKDVLMRCRWDGSPAPKEYETFIKATIFAQQQEIGANEFTDNSFIPETPDKRGNEKYPPKAKELESALNRRDFLCSTTPGYGSTTGQERERELKRTRHDRSLTLSRKRFRSGMSSNRSTPSSTGTPATRGSLPGTPHRNPKTSYVNDGEDSEEEKAEYYGELGAEPSRERCSQLPAVQPTNEREVINRSIQSFYEMVLLWPIFAVPRTGALLPDGRQRPLNLEEKLTTHLLTGMKVWIEGFMDRYGKAILPNVTEAKSIEEYRNHWKAIIIIEVRAMLSNTLSAMLPKCKADPKATFPHDLDASEFVRCRIDSVDPSKGLFNITCKSVTPPLNKRIAQELQGGTMCVGYFKGRGLFSELILIACRRVSWEGDSVAIGPEDTIDEITVHLVINRDRVREVGVWEGGTVYLRHLSHFAQFLRMYKAVMETSILPTFLRDTLYGSNQPPGITDREVMDELIDSGCSKYLTSLRETSAKLDCSQFNALCSVLANIGTCSHSSSSVSLVHGPPGTGKTSSILYLIGALLHHSTVGHVGREQVHALKHCIPPDNILRCSKNPQGVRILVCCASNRGVDIVLERIHRDGIPDGKGGAIWPQTVRLARARYDYGELKMYSIDDKALPFDEHIHHVGDTKRKSASSAARRGFYEECIIVLATLVSSGGARFKKCNIPFDVTIIDEMGQANEPEALIPMTNTSKASGHCHFVGIGDPRQLPPVSHAAFPMKCLKTYLPFSYGAQMLSLFERLQLNDRASYSMLNRQYRMCRAVADMSNQLFYSGLIQSPLPESTFDASYNKGWDPKSGCFAKQTFIDTSLLPNRAETCVTGDGDYTNPEEVNIIDEVLNRIKVLAGESFDSLRNQIAVLVPYRSQVEQLRLVLQRLGKYVPRGVSSQGFEILVDSVDSMQGSERDIVIFGSTRSNADQNVGFLDNPNRLNVACSRAKKLQIIIGDLSTLGGNKYFSEMRRYCERISDDVVLLELHPKAHGNILDGLKLYRK